ncbi:MAG: alpha/beta fold hydrolase [Leptolyngbya sp.]|nr:alpha/beta fold hydrolase [Leptolyngbya sp.]
MADYGVWVQQLQQQVAAEEAAYPLVDAACRTRFWLHPAPTARVCLLFHGFTASPHQFEPLGQRLHRAGYTVLAPLLPGHGRAGVWGPEQPPPLPEAPEPYLTFAQRWLDWAKQMGDRVAVGGLSGGGTLAAWLAYERPGEVDRALLFAPYLGASLRVVDLFVKTLDTYLAWDKTNYLSYPGFEAKALRAMLTLGEQVLARSRRDPCAPFFIISSESDQAVKNLDHHLLFERGVATQPRCWYHQFGRILDIPHTMMTTQEGNAYQDLLNTLAQAYLESDLTWAEIQDIAYTMAKGQPFAQAIRQLGWGDRASKDLPAFITLVDKRQILLDRQEGPRRGPQHRRPRDR